MKGYLRGKSEGIMCGVREVRREIEFGKGDCTDYDTGPQDRVGDEFKGKKARHHLHSRQVRSTLLLRVAQVIAHRLRSIRT